MIQLPFELTGAQRDLLQQLIMKGGDQFLLLDQKVNGAPMLVIIARGAARDVAREKLLDGTAAAPVEEVAEADQPKPPKPVKVIEGVVSRSVPASAGGQPKPN